MMASLRMIVWIQVLNCQNCNQCLKCQVSSTVFPIVKNEGEKLGWKMRAKNEGQKWGSKMRVKMRVWGSKWGTKICLIKCLKGHKSLGSLCNVVKALIASGARPTKGQTMSPIELFWTAKNSGIQVKSKLENYSIPLNYLHMESLPGTSLLDV